MTFSPKDAPEWVRPFRNILSLESANGYNDKAVIGGMDGFVRQWADSMASRVKSLPTSRSLIRPGYSAMSVAERQEWVAQWRTLLEGGEPGSSPAEPAPPAKRSQRARSPRKLDAPEEKARANDERKAPAQPPPIELDSPVTSLRRVSAKLAGQLANIGIATVRDLVFHFPHRYDDYSKKTRVADLWPGQEVTVEGRIVEAQARQLGRQAETGLDGSDPGR